MSAEYLTPDELADLRIVRARARMDRGDIQPMMLVTSGPDYAGAEVIPWLDALNMEVPD